MAVQHLRLDQNKYKTNKDLVGYCVHAESLTCRPLGEVEAVGVINFGTAGSLTGNHLSTVSAAETLVLSFFGHHHLLLLLAVAPPLQLTTFVFRWRVVLGCRGERF